MYGYRPTTRLLSMLELLQARGRMGGPELARRLEVGERTVRRYVAMLQEMGVPVEAERGRYGAYALRPGFRLPPWPARRIGRSSCVWRLPSELPDP